MDNKTSNYITGFRKTHGTQSSLIIIIKNGEKIKIRKKTFSTKFMNLSKAFDSINDDLLLAKLRA